MRIVVSLTTIPSRLKVLPDIVDSIMGQTLVPDEIALNIPKICHKESMGYDIPSRMEISYKHTQDDIQPIDMSKFNNDILDWVNVRFSEDFDNFRWRIGGE